MYLERTGGTQLNISDSSSENSSRYFNELWQIHTKVNTLAVDFGKAYRLWLRSTGNFWIWSSTIFIQNDGASLAPILFISVWFYRTNEIFPCTSVFWNSYNRIYTTWSESFLCCCQVPSDVLRITWIGPRLLIFTCEHSWMHFGILIHLYLLLRHVTFPRVLASCRDLSRTTGTTTGQATINITFVQKLQANSIMSSECSYASFPCGKD